MSVEDLDDRRETATDSTTPFTDLKQIDAGLLNVGYVDAGPADGPAVVLLHGWPYDIHSYDDVAPARGCSGARARSVPARVRDDALPLGRAPSATASRRRSPSTSSPSWTPSRSSRDRRGLRLGRTDGGHRRRALARTRRRARGGQRLPDRQPGGRQAPAPEAELSGGTSTTSPPSAVGPVTTSTGASSRGSSGGLRRRSGTSTTRPSIAAPRPSTTRIMSPSRSTTTAGGSGSLKAKLDTKSWRSGSPKAPSSPVPTITLEGDANGAPHPDPSAYAAKFSGPYSHRTLEGGIGHNLPQEAPDAFADAVLEVGGAQVSLFGTRRHAPLPAEGYLPGFDGATGWLNSAPLTAEGLRGKVVLVDFWTYTCINWLRTLALRPRVGREVPGSRLGRGRRPHARVPVRAERRQRPPRPPRT